MGGAEMTNTAATTRFENALIDLIESYVTEYGLSSKEVREVLMARADDDFDFYKRKDGAEA